MNKSTIPATPGFLWWLPPSLACLIYVLLVKLTQLQEYIRLITFDPANHLNQIAITAVLLLLTVSALHHVYSSAHRGRKLSFIEVLICFSPFGSVALSVYFAGKDIGGSRYATVRQASVFAATGIALIYASLVATFFVSSRFRKLLVWSSRFVLFTATALFLGSLALPFAPQATIVRFAQTSGPLALLLGFCTCLAVLLAAFARLPPRVRLTLFICLLTAAVFSSWFGLNDNHTVRSTSRTVDVRRDETRVIFKRWFNSRLDRHQFERYPVYLIAAAGGGYYAAYHTALVLARLQDQCDNFSQHVFAISGVSGGSVGAGVFAASINQMAPTQVSERCALQDGRQYTTAVEEYFRNDFLSPILAYALGPDLVQRFLPWPIERYDRALGLEYAIEEAWKAVRSGSSFVKNPLSQPFHSLWKLSGPTPALVLNTTRVDTGQRVVISPFRIYSLAPIWTEPVNTVWQLGLKNDLPLSTALAMSARFPYVSPAALFRGSESGWAPEQSDRTIRLVDGGYFENSGSATAMDLYSMLTEAIQEDDLPVDLKIIVIGGIEGVFDDYINRITASEAGGASTGNEAMEFRKLTDELESFLPTSPRPSTGTGELLNPFATLLGSRGDHGKGAVHSLWLTQITATKSAGADVTSDDKIAFFGLSDSNIPFPLSWVVSDPVRERIALRTTSKGCIQVPFETMYEAQAANRLRSDERVQILEEYGEDLRFVIELARASCGIEAVGRALSNSRTHRGE